MTDSTPTPRPPAVARRVPTVLLVDDDDDFRSAVAETLRLQAIHVVEAAAGDSALEALEHFGEHHHPDLAIVDLMLPVVSGLELLQRLRRSERWAEMAVVVVTGINDPMLPVRLNLPVVFKPDIEGLLAAVRQQLGLAGEETIEGRAIRMGRLPVVRGRG